MRISDDTRYPHPVLSEDSGDYSVGAFEVAFQCQETFSTGKVTLQYEVGLDNPDILALVESGAARVGAFVRCRDTYFSALEKMAWPSGQIDFPEGVLLDRVYVRPIIWLTRDIQEWRPRGVNPEFTLPLSLKAGEVIAIALESRLTVGKAKLAPLESIFSMKRLDTLEPHAISVDPDGDKITIFAGKDAYDTVMGLRATGRGKAVALASVYTPAVMELLHQWSQNSFEGRRWLKPFTAKCDAVGIAQDAPKLLEDTQKLLNHPLAGIKFEEEVTW